MDTIPYVSMVRDGGLIIVVGLKLKLCGRMTVRLICWALWSYNCQSNMLGFVVIGLSV